VKLGWTVSGADPALFTRREEGGVFYALVYVDDILMAGPKGSPVMERLKAELTKIFDIRDLDESVGVRSQLCSFVLLCCYLMHSTYAAYSNTCAVAMKACAG
jgi:hypothetical protein